MRDHNSLDLDSAMCALLKALMKDISSITGYNTEKESIRISRLMASSGRAGVLRFLEKHNDVLLGFFKTGKLDGSVRHDADNFPLFLNALWRDLLTERDITAVALLRQTMCLLRKWREDTVQLGQSTQAFLTRMREKSLHDYRIIDKIAEHLPYIIGDGDIKASDEIPVITSGARAIKTRVLDRLDTGCVKFADGRVNDALIRDGFRLTGSSCTGINRLVEVPKDWTKNRLVFAEPSERMNTQQMLRVWLEKRCACTAPGRIDFTEQEMQRRSLRKKERSSIDLTDASDHLSAVTIFRFFRKYPLLRSALFRGRSAHTIVSGETVALRCFGTMGNATTFTVMSIFLACLTREAEFHHWGYTGLRARVSTVFGDDIVCDDVIAGTVLELLVQCGLKPNGRKTFIARPFRESCGLDLWREVDVTPTYVKSVRVRSKEDVCRVVTQSNSFYLSHYWNVATELAALTRRSLSVNVDEHSLLSHVTCVSTKGCRWVPRYQKFVSAYAPNLRVCTLEKDSRLDLAYTLYHGNRVREDRKSVV